MNIKDKIVEWHNAYLWEYCHTHADIEESNKELELVLFAIDTLTDKVTGVSDE